MGWLIHSLLNDAVLTAEVT